MTRFDAREADDETLLDRLLATGPDDGCETGPARRLLDRFGTLGAVLAASPCEIERTLGIGARDQADRLSVLHHLVLCVLREGVAQRPAFASSRSLKLYLLARLGHASREEFRVLHLDGGRRLIVDELMGVGTIDHAPVYPREVVRRALELGTKSLILVHNHPGGDPSPSWQDCSTTETIVRACGVFEIKVLDHLIVGGGGGGLYSFKDNCLLAGSPTKAPGGSPVHDAQHVLKPIRTTRGALPDPSRVSRHRPAALHRTDAGRDQSAG